MPNINTISLLTFMEMRHHAGTRVGVLTIDEMDRFKKADSDFLRFEEQRKVLKTAAILGLPTWFAELGRGNQTGTVTNLWRAAQPLYPHTRSMREFFKKPSLDVFQETGFGQWIDGIKYLVVMGRESACCVSATIIGKKGNAGAVKHCYVLTSRLVVREGPSPKNVLLPTVVEHPKCFVFKAVGELMW